MIVQEKVTQALGLLQEFDIDCWITFVRESEIAGDPTLDYLLGFAVTWHSAFILTSSGKSYAIVGEFDRQTVEDLGVYSDVFGHVKGIREIFLQVMQEIAPSKIAVNYSIDSEICDGITHGMYLTLYRLLEELGFENRIISAQRLISALRERKTALEIQHIKRAIAVTEDIFRRVGAFLRPGKTEKEVADYMQQAVKAADVEFAWHERGCPAVFTGPDAFGGHSHPSSRQIQPGHLVNMDFGVRVHGYCSDLQRTYYMLKPDEIRSPEVVQKAFDDVMNAVEQAKLAIQPGKQGIDIDTIAREYLLSRGYEEFQCALGHQVGRFAHDGTALLGPAWEKYAQKPYQPLEEGMVFTLEPHAWVPGYGRATIEEMVLVTADGAEFLSTPQKELFVISC